MLRSSVVPERGQAPISSGRSDRPANRDGARSIQELDRGAQGPATVG
ncbi:hypothetical protein [Capillimicrobium parvum]|nr:hypothetical protein [Capillimicrobium parvum]